MVLIYFNKNVYHVCPRMCDAGECRVVLNWGRCVHCSEKTLSLSLPIISYIEKQQKGYIPCTDMRILHKYKRIEINPKYTK